MKKVTAQPRWPGEKNKSQLPSQAGTMQKPHKNIPHVHFSTNTLLRKIKSQPQVKKHVMAPGPAWRNENQFTGQLCRPGEKTSNRSGSWLSWLANCGDLFFYFGEKSCLRSAGLFVWRKVLPPDFSPRPDSSGRINHLSFDFCRIP